VLNNDVKNAVVNEANKIGLEPALLLAVVDVESSGTPFWNIGGVEKPIVRFEGHYFYKRLSPDKLALALKEGLASPKAGGVANPSSGAARYALIDRARALDEDAALESCSWGLGQVMGANWKDLGFSSVTELVQSANTIEGQIDLIVRFLDHNNLTQVLKAKNWTKFAKGYNGPGSNGYDIKLKQAYSRYQSTGVISDPQTVASDEVSQLQMMLNSVGSYGLTVDGKIGTNTQTAIRDFQLKNGLVVDGNYGPLTKEKLQSVYLAKSTLQQHKIGGGIAGIGIAGTSITEAANQIQPFADTSRIIQVIFIGLVVVGVAFTAYTLFFKKG